MDILRAWISQVFEIGLYHTFGILITAVAELIDAFEIIEVGDGGLVCRLDGFPGLVELLPSRGEFLPRALESPLPCIRSAREPVQHGPKMTDLDASTDGREALAHDAESPTQ